MPELVLVRGDITQQEVDAIVNAANSSLMGGAGVDGAIHARGGPVILEECRQIRAERYPDGLPPGEAVATTAGDLPAQWVIHTVGPIYSQSFDPAGTLESCHLRCLEVAESLRAASIAFPAISTGAYGYPVDEAAPIAIESVLRAQTSTREIRFVLFGDASFDAFRLAAEKYRARPDVSLTIQDG